MVQFPPDLFKIMLDFIIQAIVIKDKSDFAIDVLDFTDYNFQMKILAFVMLCLIWGSTWIAIKISLEGIPPILGAGFRFVISILVLLVLIWFKRLSLKINKKFFWISALTGFLIYSLDYGLIYWAEQYLSAGVTSIFFATFVLFTTLGANFIFRQEGFNWKTFLGVWVGFLGVIMVFFDQLIITKFAFLVIVASLAVILSAACAGLSTVIIKKYLFNMNPVVLTFYQLIVGTFFLLFAGILAEDVQQIHLNSRVLGAVLYLGIVGSAMAFVMYYWLLQRMSAITLSFIIYLTPLVAIILDFLFFKELITFQALLGMAVIFIGIGFTQYTKTQKQF
jgi:drug/metabolite transporter (DMT)-like permease